MTQIKANEDAAHVAEVAKPHGDHGHGGGHGHGAPLQYPYVQHHFDSPQQQFDSGKLGIWLFLVTEILFFSGLFCAYTVYRAQHPEVFYWAHFYLDTNLGALNTIVLIFSSLTAAWAVRNAQRGETKLLKINILLTIGCALTFMGVKYVEYSHKFHDGLLPARHFDPKHEVWEIESFKKKHPEAAEAMARLMAKLEERKATAALDVEVPTRKPLELTPVQLTVAQPAAADASAAQATAVEATAQNEGAAAPGAEPNPAPRSASPGADAAEGTAEPAPAAGEGQAEGSPEGAPAPASEPTPEGAAPDAAQAAPSPVAPPAQKTLEPLADDVFIANELRKLTPAEATPLLRAGVLQRRADGPYQLVRPEKAGIFFSIYFFMTGLHGVHVLIGIGIWVWMLVRAGRRRFGPEYFGPIDFSALYWHLVDLIWIYLFPLLYLIH